MGLLMEEVGDGGLFLPIVAHTIADFYLFSSVARGKVTGATAKPKSATLAATPPIPKNKGWCNNFAVAAKISRTPRNIY